MYEWGDLFVHKIRSPTFPIKVVVLILAAPGRSGGCPHVAAPPVRCILFQSCVELCLISTCVSVCARQCCPHYAIRANSAGPRDFPLSTVTLALSFSPTLCLSISALCCKSAHRGRTRRNSTVTLILAFYSFVRKVLRVFFFFSLLFSATSTSTNHGHHHLRPFLVGCSGRLLSYVAFVFLRANGYSG